MFKPHGLTATGRFGKNGTCTFMSGSMAGRVMIRFYFIDRHDFPMAITCPRCGAGFDVTLFQFGRRVRCVCGAWVDLGRGHVLADPDHSQGIPTMSEKAIGTVTHYFGKIQVAGIRITGGALGPGDRIHIQGHTSDFTQTVGEIQIDGKVVEQAGPGDEIGIKVADHAREHDTVYKIED